MSRRPTLRTRRMSLSLSGSRALLVGCSAYGSDSLPDLPSVADTLTDLAAVLINSCNMDPANVQVIHNPASTQELGFAIARLSQEATDVLLFYYVGHGLLDEHGELYLSDCATDGRPSHLPYSAIRYSTARGSFLNTTARSSLIVLDSCWSGRAIATLGDDDPADLVGVDGAVVIAASARDELAHAPLGERNTAFSGALISYLRQGDPGGPEVLTVADAFRHLLTALPAAGRPAPKRHVSGRADVLALAENVAFGTDPLAHSRFAELVNADVVTVRQAFVLLALTRYLRQLDDNYSEDDFADALLAEPTLTALIISLFEARHDPKQVEREHVVRNLSNEVRARVEDSVEDRSIEQVFTKLINIISANVRSNYFLQRPQLAFCFDSSAVPGSPYPRPLRDYFVCSAQAAGVFLAFGPLPRGPLVLRDRIDGIRDGVLDAAPSEIVRSAHTVTGRALGAFAPIAGKWTREEACEAYGAVVNAMLEITDDFHDGQITAAAGIVRHDGDSAFLIVEGTDEDGDFADVGARVAAQRGYWLHRCYLCPADTSYQQLHEVAVRSALAFAEEHFGRLGVDPTADPVTMIAIGDLTGVLSRVLRLRPNFRLIAAIGDTHILLDPDPGAAGPPAELSRILASRNLARTDIDNEELCLQIGLWPRRLKSIPVSPAVDAALGLEGQARLRPDELIRGILRAPVDLLWVDSSATLIKHGGELNEGRRNRRNPDPAVDADSLRTKIIVESRDGGISHAGRVAFARSGGRITTASMDSIGTALYRDRLILNRMATGMANGRTESLGERSDQDSTMQYETANVVLADVKALARELDEPIMRDVFGSGVARLIAQLARQAENDPAMLEPADQIVERMDRYWTEGAFPTTPEVVSVAAYVRASTYDAIVRTDLPDTVSMFSTLVGFFSETATTAADGGKIFNHPLRREIIASRLANDVVDLSGTTFLARLTEELPNASVTDAVRAHVVGMELVGLQSIWVELERLPRGDRMAHELTARCRNVLARVIRWFLSNRPQPLTIGAELARFAGPVCDLSEELSSYLFGRERESVLDDRESLVGDGVPGELASKIAGFAALPGLLDIVDICEIVEREGQSELSDVAKVYFGLSEHLGIALAKGSLNVLPVADGWDSAAKAVLRDDLDGSLRAITLNALAGSWPGASVEEAIAQWERDNSYGLVRARSALYEIAMASDSKFTTMIVIGRALRGLTR